MEPWVSVEDVAAHLGVRKDSIYRWIDGRGLPARKIGKLWKLKLSEVDAWVRAHGAAEEPPATTPPRRKRPARRVILVVDDDPLVRDTIADFLGDAGHDVLLAANGAEALTLLSTADPRPSLIILDLKMPRLDGWSFREQQSRDPELAGIPVIVLTAAAPPSVSGAATVLRKPLQLPRLGQAIESLLDATPGAEP